MSSLLELGKLVQRGASALGIIAPTKNSLGVNVPEGLITMIFALDEGDSGTAMQNLGEAMTDISVAGQFLYCFGETMLNPSQLGSMLTGMATNLLGTMAQVMNAITDALMYQVSIAISTVIGSVMSAIEAVMSLINSILDLINLIVNLPKLIYELATGSWFNWKKIERCDEVVAAILACLLNKLLGDPIQTFQNKMVEKINEYGYTANQAIADEFYDLNVMTSYIEQEAFFLNKANYQIEGLYADFGVVVDPLKAAQYAKDKEEQAKESEKKVSFKEDGTVVVSNGTNTQVKTEERQNVIEVVLTPEQKAELERKQRAQAEIEKSQNVVTSTIDEPWKGQMEAQRMQNSMKVDMGDVILDDGGQGIWS